MIELGKGVFGQQRTKQIERRGTGTICTIELCRRQGLPDLFRTSRAAS